MPDNQKKCFAGNETNKVTLENGQEKYVEDVKVGDQVLVMTQHGDMGVSEVYVLSHTMPDLVSQFYEISTENRQITLSDLHYIKVTREGQKMDVMAKDVIVGDLVFVRDQQLYPKGLGIETEEVVNTEVVEGRGIFAPFTKEGTLLVNGMFVSCYSTVRPNIAHKLAAPLRAIYDLTPTPIMEKLTTANNDGKPYIMVPGSQFFRTFVEN